jgi:hypothetical protein
MSDRIKLVSGEQDGAAAIAHELDTIENLVNGTAALFQVKNDGTLEFSVGASGIGWFSSGLYVNQDDEWNNAGVQIGGGTNSIMACSGKVATGGAMRLQVTEGVGATLRNMLSLQTDGSAFISPQVDVGAGATVFAVYNDSGNDTLLHIRGNGRCTFGGACDWAYEATAVTMPTTGVSNIIGVTDTSASRTITLATGQDNVAGRVIIIKDESGAAGSGFPILIKTSGGTIDGIDGATGIQINADYGVARLYSNGTNWFTF